jgi:hypothetical protein
LLTHPHIDYQLAEFVCWPFPDAKDPEGTYDLLCDEGRRLLALRYLDFIPFLDLNRTTPAVERYLVSLQDDKGGGRLDLGGFDGTLDEMRRCGGLVHFSLPEGKDVDGRRLVVEAVKKEYGPLPLVRESEWDLQLVPTPDQKREIPWTPRGVVLPFGGSTDVSVKVFRLNRPAEGQTVRWNEPKSNGRSPLVDRFAEATGRTDDKGVATVQLWAAGINNETKSLDRFYGNRVVAEIDNPDHRCSNGIQQVKIAVRVLHKYRAGDLPDVPSFERDIRPLFSYHTRYYPWLHVQDNGKTFDRFLDLDDYKQFCDHIYEILRRLDLDPNDHDKMPRSRDFPLGGVELIRRWRDTGMAP